VFDGTVSVFSRSIVVDNPRLVGVCGGSTDALVGE
jgi:hypothetical protein